MLREHLKPENVAFGLTGDAESAIRKLIADNSGADLTLVRDAFANAGRSPYASVEHGVLIPHVRVHGLSRTIAALGISREGLSHSSGKVYVVLLMALPAGETAHELQLLQGMSSVLPVYWRVHYLWHWANGYL